MIFMTYYKRIDNLKMDKKDKEGYKWLFCNFDAVKMTTKNCKTIEEFRIKCYKEIGFAPAPLFSFKHLFKTRETYIKELEKVF